MIYKYFIWVYRVLGFLFEIYAGILLGLLHLRRDRAEEAQGSPQGCKIKASRETRHNGVITKSGVNGN
jgi:hypothetical protein